MQLASDRQSLRKKAIVALSCLAVVADNPLYENTLNTVLENVSMENVLFKVFFIEVFFLRVR